VLDALCAEPDRQQQLAASWLQLLQTNSSTSGRSGNLTQEAVEAAFQGPDEHGMHGPGQLLSVVPDGRLQLFFTGVAAVRALPSPDNSTASAAAADPAQLLRLSCTPWLVISMARIMAAATVQGPLLLEGAPGIGKTAVVQEVSRLLGYGCERINLSSNTSLDQLLGSFIPRMVDGQRVFAWQDGVMVRAIRERKWLLLDEINLAQPEVLAAIAPLLDR
jgi:Cdc6-like AAA superfamily ATPase